MFQRLALVLLLFLVASGGAIAHAQDPEQQAEAKRRADEMRQAQEAAAQDRAERDKSIRALNDFLNPPASNADKLGPQLREAQRKAKYLELRDALLLIETGHQELMEGMDSKKTIKKSAGKIAKGARTFLQFMKFDNKYPPLDAAEFKGYTDTELQWEALRTAEVLAPRLTALILSDVKDELDIRFLAEVPEMHRNLLRLQWITQRLK